MLSRLFVTLVILIALVVGILALTLPRDQIVRLIMFRDFFEVTLPILAFGALIKYLCCCPHGHGSKNCACPCHAKGQEKECMVCRSKGCC